jgi:hypothetical protein
VVIVHSSKAQSALRLVGDIPRWRPLLQTKEKLLPRSIILRYLVHSSHSLSTNLYNLVDQPRET